MRIGDRFYRGYSLALFALALAGAALHLLLRADAAFLWTDELFSWSVAVQTSWTGLWQAMYRGSDGMFPAFYVFSWCWSRLFGQTELVLRLPSIGFALTGAVACFALLRRLWGEAAASASVGVMMLGNGLLLTQAAQFRGYGMLLGLTALSVCWLVLLSPEHPCRRRLLVAHGATQVLLCLTHPFGVLYSALLGLGKMIANATTARRIWDWGLAWSYVPAVVGLLIWLPGLRAVARLNVPRGWVPAVTLNDLGLQLLPALDGPWGSGAVFGGVLLLLLGTALSRPVQETPEGERSAEPLEERRTAVLLAVALLAVGPLAWGVSRFSEPLLVARYLVPAAWAWAILGAFLWSRIARDVPRSMQLAAATTVLALAAVGLLTQHFPQLGNRFSQVDPLLQRLHRDRLYASGEMDRIYLKERLPVFVEGIHSFLARDHYNPGHYDYRLLLNKKAAWEDRDVKGASIETNLALKLLENGLPPSKILDLREAGPIVSQMEAFYVVDLVDRPTLDALPGLLHGRGWREEIVCPAIDHPDAGMAVIRKFTRPPVSAPSP